MKWYITNVIIKQPQRRKKKKKWKLQKESEIESGGSFWKQHTCDEIRDHKMKWTETVQEIKIITDFGC